MSLRARLLLAIAGLLTLALLASGAAVVALTRASLVEQLDEELRSATIGDFRPGRGAGGIGRDPTGRRLALVLLDAQGRVVEAVPSGFARNPDPLPEIAFADGRPPVGRITEQAAANGLRYRVLLVRSPVGDGYVALAAPMREVNAVTRQLIVNLLAVSALVLALALLVGWLLIRRQMRPLEHVTETAERISGGDLSRRVGAADERTEVGRLAGAFDGMLDHIEAAFAAQHRALAEKERSEGQLRQFVADASHELRTPLTTLRGYSELYAAGGLEGDAAVSQAMRRIGTESRRMAQLVDDLLLLARLDQGRPLRHEPVSLSQLVRDAVADASAIEPTRPIEATIADEVRVRGDEDRLRQVVTNLLANVRVHTPADTPVDVRLTASNGQAILEVADHGPGIPQEHADRVFDRFYRADGGRSRDRGGSGLGLAIVSAVTAAHGGSIAHAPTPGGGATFTVSLPTA